MVMEVASLQKGEWLTFEVVSLKEGEWSLLKRWPV